MWLDTTNMVCGKFVPKLNLTNENGYSAEKFFLPHGTELLPSRKIMLLSFISQDYPKKSEQNHNFRKILTF